MKNESFTFDDPLDPIACRNFLNQIIDHIETIQGLWILGCTALTDALLHRMCSKHNDLKCINISSCYKITNIGFNTIIKCCKNLRRLDAKMLSNLTDDCVVSIEHDTTLESLDIGYSFLTDIGLTTLVTKCPKLQRLDLGFCKNLSDQAVIAISKTCINLKELILNRCKKITDTGIYSQSLIWDNILVVVKQGGEKFLTRTKG